MKRKKNENYKKRKRNAFVYENKKLMSNFFFKHHKSLLDVNILPKLNNTYKNQNSTVISIEIVLKICFGKF